MVVSVIVLVQHPNVYAAGTLLAAAGLAWLAVELGRS
jgi:hypothetical protein